MSTTTLEQVAAPTQQTPPLCTGTEVCLRPMPHPAVVSAVGMCAHGVSVELWCPKAVAVAMSRGVACGQGMSMQEDHRLVTGDLRLDLKPL